MSDDYGTAASVPAPEVQQSSQQSRPGAVAGTWHTVVLIAFLFAMAALQFLQYRSAVSMSQIPNLVVTYVATIVYEWVLVGYVWLFGLRRRHVTIAEIIGGRWKRALDFWRDIGIALLFFIVVSTVIAGLSKLLNFSGEEAAKELLPRTYAEMAVFVLLAASAGFCEELVFRGYLQRQFLAWTGNVSASIALQAVVFGVAHLYQGLKGVVVIAVYGSLFGILAAMRKSLRPGMMQHFAQDSISGIGGAILRKMHYLQMIRF